VAHRLNHSKSRPVKNITSLNKEPIKIHTDLPSGTPTELRCDAYLAAVGRILNTEDLNLSNAGIQADDYGGIILLS
jgi:pyruvate/2-oxoglutarate dehydrogenase complex dihydrolipoamide dehydrogenase (E3) component